MILLFVAALIGDSFTPPQPWALDLAPKPVIPLVGDLDGDGLADIVTVNPDDGAINLTRTVEGIKSAVGIAVLSTWKGCQAAVVGSFDGEKGADLIGLFGGKELRLAGTLKDGKLTDRPNWLILPTTLKDGHLALMQGGKSLLAFSPAQAFRIDIASRQIEPIKIPHGMAWGGDSGSGMVFADAKGRISLWDAEMKRSKEIGQSSAFASTTGEVLIGDIVWTPGGEISLTPSGLPKSNSVFAFGDIDGDGDQDLVEFRRGTEIHTGGQVLVRRAVSPGETDPDHDGLTNDQEKELGTDPLNPDTDKDGLLDGWEVGCYRGLDMKALGCDPLRTDVICLISRFDDVDGTQMKAVLDRVGKTYDTLDTPNPGGKKGFGFHPILLDPVKGEDRKGTWWANRDKFRPEKWRGMVHWMQITRGGGGQADELGDGGSIGSDAMWAVFLHEFGHQMGMNHEGFWANGMCPIYPSLMNYNYSYSLEDDGNKIGYSKGALVGYTLNETDLDETIPLPYDKVKFLEKGPYRFRLKPNGNTTLIDWNWNGVFGEKHVRADVNYAYSTNAGTRDDLGKTKSAPFVFVHRNEAYALLGTNDKPVDPKSDPTISPTNPGKLLLRRMEAPKKWGAPITVDEGLTGDPVAASFGGKIRLVYSTPKGIVMRTFGDKDDPTIISPDLTLVPTVGEYGRNLYVFLWNPQSNEVVYRILGKSGELGPSIPLDVKSTNPVGLCTDTKTGEAILGIAQDQDANRKHRWQIRRYSAKGGVLAFKSFEWIEGVDGQSRGMGRITVLFDGSKDAGPNGRMLFYGLGLTSPESPWSCAYVAQQIADRSIHGGWLVKRYYDEWSQSRSAPAAAWFQGDVLYAYRWVDGGQGETDNNFHLGYHGLGISPDLMGDHDDLAFFRTFGIRNSLLSLGVAQN